MSIDNKCKNTYGGLKLVSKTRLELLLSYTFDTKDQGNGSQILVFYATKQEGFLTKIKNMKTFFMQYVLNVK